MEVYICTVGMLYKISVEWDHIHRKEGTLWVMSSQDLKRILNAVTYGGSPRYLYRDLPIADSQKSCALATTVISR